MNNTLLLGRFVRKKISTQNSNGLSKLGAKRVFSNHNKEGFSPLFLPLPTAVTPQFRLPHLFVVLFVDLDVGSSKGCREAFVLWKSINHVKDSRRIEDMDSGFEHRMQLARRSVVWRGEVVNVDGALFEMV